MKITIESTGEITTVDGVPVRAWNGKTEGGVECIVFIHLIAVHGSHDKTAFERELEEQAAPAELSEAIDLRRILP